MALAVRPRAGAGEPGGARRRAEPSRRQGGGGAGGGRRVRSGPLGHRRRPGAAPALDIRAMTALPWPVIVAALALLLGLALAGFGQGLRRRRGLGAGKTVALDNVTLTSRLYRLTARPDRLVKSG